MEVKVKGVGDIVVVVQGSIILVIFPSQIAEKQVPFPSCVI